MASPARVRSTPPPTASTALPAPGDVVGGRYRIERPLARGGMGAVYVAEHTGLARPVALKFLNVDAPGARERFVREARATARLSSEHIVRVLDVGVHGELPFLAMELLFGTDLLSYFSATGPLSIAEAAGYVLQACEGLAEAHAQGIVHRDLKPSNLFLTQRADGSSLVKVLDFGIAKAPPAETWTGGHLTGAIEILGSPPYMSPEHLRDAGSVDARTDLWSLGILLYELVTGRHPFEAPSAMLVGAKIAIDPPAPMRAHLPEVPEAFEHVVLKCLEKEPSARFESVVALARALAPFAGGGAWSALGRMERASASVASATVVAVPRPSNRPKEATSPEASAVVSVAASPERPSSEARPSYPEPASGVIATTATSRFRRQHEELQKLGLAIAQKLSRKTLPTEARLVRRMVAQFAGKLAVHASMENGALYPRLLAHPDPQVKARAKALFDEVGKIYSTFDGYSARWPTSTSIEADPGGFAKETRELLMLLACRMVRENDELYPLVDEVESAAS